MLSFNESDSFDDDYDNDESDSGSVGTCTFPFRFEESIGSVDNFVGHFDDYIGRVCGVGSGVFVLIGIKSIGEVVPLVVFVPNGFESKGSLLIEIFWHPKS